MKKIILSGIVLFLGNAIFAQHVEFGLKAGVNISKLVDDADVNANSRAGLNIGGLAHIHLSKEFAVQPEVVFSMQGASYDNDAKSTINYINIPVLAQYMFGDGFRVQTGPQLGFLTSAKSKIGGVTVNSKSSIQSTDFSWSFGAGYITKQHYGVDARYNLGISDISKNNSGLKNRVWQIGLFYQFSH